MSVAIPAMMLSEIKGALLDQADRLRGVPYGNVRLTLEVDFSKSAPIKWSVQTSTLDVRQFKTGGTI